MKKTAFAIFIALVFLLGLASCDRVKIEIKEPKEEPVSEAFNEETNIENPSEPEEPAEEPETESPVTESPEEASTLEAKVSALVAKELGVEEDQVFLDNGFISCGNGGLFALCAVDGFYALYTDGDSFAKLIELDWEHYVMHANYMDGSSRLTMEGKTVTLKNEHIGEKLVFDFGRGSYEHSFCVTDNSLGYELKTSPNGKYTIWELNSVGRGDAGYHRIAVKDNETGEILVLREVGLLGGMYGGYGGAGFFKNGEIYIYSAEQMKVFDPQRGAPTFDMGKNFPLGNTADGEYTALLSFHRDPEDFSYSITYMKEEGPCTLEDTKYNRIFAAPWTYQIGFLDKDGNLLESYDTGVGVLEDHFGLADVSMRFADDTITLFAKGNESDDLYKIGVFDRKTHEFTESFEKV